MATILYTKKNSEYNYLLQDCYNITRDARTWKGGNPIIAHPPCRGWGDHSWKSKATPEEKALAIHALIMVRLWGGILEHPRNSKLWKLMRLPMPGETDQYGGWTLNIDQKWFGHRAKKNTFLYIVGIKPKEIPPYPIWLEKHKTTIEKMGKPEREKTPEILAIWLIQMAETIQSKNGLPKLLTSISKTEPKYINNSLSQNNI